MSISQKNNITQILDRIIENCDETYNPQINKTLRNNIDKWNWGKYGWISAVSLIVTVSWRKHFFNNEDCCKIWSRTSGNEPIEGAYSLRTLDEQITIPLFSKHDLCKQFCSDNSGMQGLRAVEKMRDQLRLNRNFGSSQKTVFDLNLFASILNDIDELNESESIETFKYLVSISKKIQKDRTNQYQKLKIPDIRLTKSVIQTIDECADPEVIKCAAGACLKIIYKNDYVIYGIDQKKTSADARSGSAGDLWLVNKTDSSRIIGVEIKDKSKYLDWNVIRKIESLIEDLELNGYIYISGNRKIFTENLIKDSKEKIFLDILGKNVVILSIYDLISMALFLSNELEIFNLTKENATHCPSIKNSSINILQS